MFMRTLIAVGVICASTIPALAQPVKPTAVITAKPLSRLLTDYREMIRQVGGPSGDQLVVVFDDQIKEALGDQGFEGFDINRPIAAYTFVKEKFEDSNPILVVPVSGEKEFLAFMKRMKWEANAVKDKKGLYMLRVRGLDFLPNDSYVQFVDNWAYVGLNGDDVSDPKNRLPVESLFENADLSLFTVKFFPGRFPEKLLKEWLEKIDAQANTIKGFLAGGGGPAPEVIKMMQAFLEEGPKLLRRFGETGIKEAEEIRAQFSWEPANGDTVTEVTLVPKAGSPLAKEIAAKAATIHRFAGWKHPNAVFAGAVKVPLFAKELREIIATAPAAIEAGLKTGNVPEPFLPLLEEVAKSATQTIKKSELDAAVALVGPDKNGKFTLVAAMSMADTTAIDKALRQTAKDGDLAKEFKFDVEKVGGVSIHKVPIARAFHDEALRELSKAFGEYPPAFVALAKDAAYLSFGPEGLEAIKTALEAKPGPAPVLEVTGNTSRFQKLLAATAGAQEADTFAKLIGSEDKLASLVRVTVEGGQTLKAKATVNLNYLPRLQLLP
ncbi:MAG TPA: hypothetical protein VG097_15115 [Gemmata sp.]|jgi:hypothetical protein|nr:hypothetical protein [Gemmata sp.]